jgi:hypothetical protein
VSVRFRPRVTSGLSLGRQAARCAGSMAGNVENAWVGASLAHVLVRAAPSPGGCVPVIATRWSLPFGPRLLAPEEQSDIGRCSI